MEIVLPGMQQVLIKVSCCHYEPPTCTYTFRKIQWGLEGERPELGAQKLSSCGRQGGLKWSCGGGNGEKCGCSVGGAEGPQRHVTTSLGCPVWSETNPQKMQWGKGFW